MNFNFSARALFGIGLVLSGLAVRAAEVPSAVEELREQTAESAVQGCALAIFQPAVRTIMKRAEDAGKPFASEAEARAKLESFPQWQSTLLPSLKRACSCWMDEQLQAIRSATTQEEIDAAVAALQELPGSMRALAQLPKYRRCTEDNLKPFAKP
jgi:hypothetical protein